jgi:hypothetical protein
MALTMEKAVKDLIAILKKEVFPGETKKSYWNKLTEQLAEDGSWEDEVINQTKDGIAAWLDKLKKNDLASIWEESETALDEYEDEDLPEKDIIIDQLIDDDDFDDDFKDDFDDDDLDDFGGDDYFDDDRY